MCLLPPSGGCLAAKTSSQGEGCGVLFPSPPWQHTQACRPGSATVQTQTPWGFGGAPGLGLLDCRRMAKVWGPSSGTLGPEEELGSISAVSSRSSNHQPQC